MALCCVLLSAVQVNAATVYGDDNTQMQRYSEKFPVSYEYPAVKGITLWGYIEGQTWKLGTHLITSSGVERPALKWLKQYLATH
jgi:endo-1,4-beta-xylanase